MSIDDILRTASDDHAGRAKAERLTSKNEDELYRLLARAAIAGDVESDPDDLRRGLAAEDITRSSEFAAFGQRLFSRWSKSIHEFVCSPEAGDKALQDRIKSAFGMQTGGTAVIAGAIVAAFGASPAVAAVVAALLVKLVVVPAKEELCLTWATSLKAPPAPKGK